MEEPKSIDELLSISMIDPVRHKRISIELTDSDEDTINLADVVQKLSQWVSDKLSDKELNACKQQVMPLMAQSMVRTLSHILGADLASMMLGIPVLRESILRSMILGFYLLKFIQKHELDVTTLEADISEDEISSIMRTSAISDVLVRAATLGLDPKDVVRELVRSGRINQGDLEKLGLENIEIEPEEDKKESN